MNGEEEVIKLVNRILKIEIPECFSSEACSKCNKYFAKCKFHCYIYDKIFCKIECKSCKSNAIMFNPINNSLSCHACGEIFCDIEKVIYT